MVESREKKEFQMFAKGVFNGRMSEDLRYVVLSCFSKCINDWHLHLGKTAQMAKNIVN